MRETLRKILVLTILISLGAVIFPFTQISAAPSFSRVTISDSAPEATPVTYEFDFHFQETATSTTFTFPVAFGTRNGVVDDTGEVNCVAAGLVITCTDTYAAETTHTWAFTAMANPEKVAAAGVADTYHVELETSYGEIGDAMFAIIEPVVVSARVSASLAFVVEGVADTLQVNGNELDITTTPTAIEFGTLGIGTPLIAAQDLSVTTNAGDGYSVTVWQDQDLTSPGGYTIKSFNEGTSVSTSAAIAWGTGPSGDLNDEDTWGHFGFTSEDHQVAGSCIPDPATPGGYFVAEGWAGFSGSIPEEIMCHTGPSDGLATHIGKTRVGYQIEITALQPAGQYTNTLTYIATPTF